MFNFLHKWFYYLIDFLHVMPFSFFSTMKKKKIQYYNLKCTKVNFIGRGFAAYWIRWQQKISDKCLRVHLVMCIAHDPFGGYMLWTSNKSLKYHIIKWGEDLLHGSCAMPMTRWTLRHLSLIFCCHLTQYAAIAAYWYAANPLPI